MDVHIIDENGSTVWSCNSWSNSEPCDNFEYINLPNGNYNLAVQSELCNIYQSITIRNNDIDESCLTNHFYNLTYESDFLLENAVNDFVQEGNELNVYIGNDPDCSELILDENNSEVGLNNLQGCPYPSSDGVRQKVIAGTNSRGIKLFGLEDGQGTLILNYYFPQGTQVRSIAKKVFEKSNGDFVAFGLRQGVPFGSTGTSPYFLTFNSSGEVLDLTIGEPVSQAQSWYNYGETFIIDEINELYIFTNSNSNTRYYGYDFEGNRLWQDFVSLNTKLSLINGMPMIGGRFFNTTSGSDNFYNPLGITSQSILSNIQRQYPFVGELNNYSSRRFFPTSPNSVTVSIRIFTSFPTPSSKNIIYETNDEGDVFWMREFPTGFEHRAVLENGDHVFVRENEDSFDLIRLNGQGLVVSCEMDSEPTDCTIIATPSPGQLTLSGLTGQDLIANVFNSNGELVWTCNYWSDNCSESSSIDLPAGSYGVAVQSNICDFYEVIQVPAGRLQTRRQISDNVHNIELFPNPARDLIYLNLESSDENMLSVSIQDGAGRQVYTENLFLSKGFNQVRIETADLQTGMHFLTLIGLERQTVAQKFIKL